jgi:ORF6N domain
MITMGKAKQTGGVSVEQTQSILVFRGHKVLLDSDLADLYGVPTKAFNQAVKRNVERFPEDFMFRLSQAEAEALNRSQLVTGSRQASGSALPALRLP